MADRPVSVRRPREGGHAGVLLAGGRSAAQPHGPDVATLSLAGRRLVSRSLAALTQETGVAHVVVVVHRDDQEVVEQALQREAPGVSVQLVPAGLSVQQSLYAALSAIAEDIRAGRYDLVVIHDAARPLAGPALARSVIEAAHRWGAAVPHLGPADYVWIDDRGASQRFSDRDNFVHIQWPQAYRAADLLHAYQRSAAEGFLAGTAVEAVQRHCGQRVHAVPGSTRNIHIRTPTDLFTAEGLLAEMHYLVP
jgi:2-C-methyl-D-erythritol 4-phosphate cytidylyltransferase